jgi:hypothetical protein
MHLASVVTIVSIVGMVSAAANPVANAGANPIANAEANPIANADDDISVLDVLEKRACDYNGCKCAKGTKRGQYCGYCPQVYPLGKGGDDYDVFECNPQGGCCNYGFRKSCKAWNGPCGP